MAEEYELVITEKPKVSAKVANALGKAQTAQYKDVKYYIVDHDGKKTIVAPAVGHVFGLKSKGGSGYPLFDIEWVPISEINKKAGYTKKYLNALKYLAKGATSWVNACDYDIEGSVIGYNVLAHVCGKKAVEKSKRMKFSSLTEKELSKAYKEKGSHLNFGMVDAGLTRHTLDWYWGVNTSRELSSAYKAVTGYYLTLSAGRVQTPTLKILDDKDQEIKAFKSTPFWVLSAILKSSENKENNLTAVHEKEKFLNSSEAEKIYEICKNSKATVKSLKSSKFKQKPPVPFNLGDLQTEAYKLFKITPKQTQSIAQYLYEQGALSYPRTSSQKLPEGFTIKELLDKLAKNKNDTNLIVDVKAMPK